MSAATSYRSQQLVKILHLKDRHNFLQDDQLSQRDRAAGCVIDFAKSGMEDWNWETIFYGHYRSIFNHCDIIGLKICRIRDRQNSHRYTASALHAAR